MRRVAIVAAVLLLAVWGASVALAGGDEDPYLVRAYFDNGSFAVEGEEVRAGGANIGVIEEVDVSLGDERVSNVEGEEVDPGTAVLVLKIDDPGFTDFREDASCILRPQSLIGERYVDCTTTEPRSDADEAPPPLAEIPEGQPGAGQLMLPVENNAKTVDVDLLNNIYRKPYADRFRLILNDLGAGFAARGEEIAEIVERADPTLREGNKVLEQLAEQRKTLAQLTRDSDEILEPLANARGDVTGFIRNTAVPARVTAERRAQLEQALTRFPTFLRELRATMTEFDRFTGTAAPVLEKLGVAAPELARATEALEPFASASTKALRSLGNAGEKAGPLFAEADPIVRKARDLAISGQSPTRNLKKFLGSVESSGGFEALMGLIYNTGGSLNGFDEYGHYMRTLLSPVNCPDYVINSGFFSGCSAQFTVDDPFSASSRPTKVAEAVREELEAGGVEPDRADSPSPSGEGGPAVRKGGEHRSEGRGEPSGAGTGEGADGDGARSQGSQDGPTGSGRAARALLDFLVAP